MYIVTVDYRVIQNNVQGTFTRLDIAVKELAITGWENKHYTAYRSRLDENWINIQRSNAFNNNSYDSSILRC